MGVVGEVRVVVALRFLLVVVCVVIVPYMTVYTTHPGALIFRSEYVPFRVVYRCKPCRRQ